MKTTVTTIIGILGVLLLVGVTMWAIMFSDIAWRVEPYALAMTGATEPTVVRGPKVTHQEMPSEVRAIYMTACYGASPKLRNNLVRLIDETELNAIIIDIKDYTGTIAVPTSAKILAAGQEGSGCKIRDIKEFIELLHSKGIYVIARVTVFQDPLYAKVKPELAVKKKSDKNAVWIDHKGLAFIDVGAREYWDYIITLAKEAHNELGFDEINFDYVRYPSDGNMSDTYYPHSGGERENVKRAEELEKFFKYLSEKMREPNAYGEVPKISADLFGMTATNYDDLTIGQVLERALPYFDVIAPMVYPSHYPKSFLGLGNPNKNVYKVVNYSMAKAVERAKAERTNIPALAYEQAPQVQDNKTTGKKEYIKPSYSADKLRSWIQDFDYGGEYGVAEVNAQIQASRDAGVTGGYMIWDPTNRYTRGVSY